MASRGRIEKFQGKRNKQFYFRVKASNGQVVCQSEGYTRRANRDHAIDRLAGIVSNAVVVDV